MKKIYSISVTLILALTLSLQGVAQTGTECLATAFYSDGSLSGGQCGVFITGAPANATIRAYSGADTDLTIPGPFKTNGSGGGIVGTVCGTFPKYVTFTAENGTYLCFTLVNQDIVTPIKLTAFSASVKGSSSVILTWTSAQELNSSVYSVEKSGDGKSFTTVGSVKAAGTSNSPLNYVFTDNSFAGTGFFRLKMIDIDGTFAFSKIVYVNGGSGSTNGTLSVFPNPFRSDVQLKGINASDVNKNNIRVFSATGKEVSFKVSGSNSISIDPTVPSGVYLLRVAGQTYKLFKEQK